MKKSCLAFLFVATVLMPAAIFSATYLLFPLLLSSCGRTKQHKFHARMLRIHIPHLYPHHIAQVYALLRALRLAEMRRRTSIRGMLLLTAMLHR